MDEGFEVSLTTPRKRPFKTVFQFKITLIGAEPPIWRRILVPGSYTFYDQHVAIQNAMGWTDSHLHAYEIPGKRPARIESPYAIEDLHEKPDAFTTEARIPSFLKKEHTALVVGVPSPTKYATLKSILGHSPICCKSELNIQHRRCW